MVSAHLKTIRPAGLGNEPSRQVALFDALCSDSGLSAGMAAEFLPTRADTVTLYRRLQTGSVSAEDLQPLFADMGVDNTGKTLASLRALTELGLIETRNGKFQPVAVSGKKDLASAPILKKIANRG
ncbi:MAG: single-stranded-DNA-specific exonuclease RecJ, partial [Gemmiger sp.]